MENLVYRDIDCKILTPPSEIKLHGRRYPCPAKVDEFLFDRYGEGWSRSNPYHEWSWIIERRVYFNDKTLSDLYDQREKQRKYRYGNTRTRLVAWSQCVSKNKRPPSNSVPMLLQAIDYGFDVIELDLRVTRDGEIVLAHDDLVENNAGEKIYLSKSSLEQVVNFRLGDFQREEVFMASLSRALQDLSGKQVLLDARFKPQDYSKLKHCIDNAGFDPSMLIFCVYNEKQVEPLIRNFPESLLFWKFYTQAWEIDPLVLDQVRMYGVDGIMFMYPHYDEDISESMYQIKRRDLKSMCFIHGQDWTPPHSSGLSPNQTVRSVDCYNASLKMMVAMGIEYVTTTECSSEVFVDLIGRNQD